MSKCPGLLGLQKHGIKPIQAFEHPSFKEMIAVAAHATRGVALPSMKATCAYIVKLFKKNVTNLRERINVSGIQFPFLYFVTDLSAEKYDWPCLTHLRCMASRKSRCLLCSDRSLE
jgi:hypothetical protein